MNEGFTVSARQSGRPGTIFSDRERECYTLLEQLGIAYEWVEFSRQPETTAEAEEVDRALGVPGLKNLIFQNRNRSRTLFLLLPREKRLDAKALAKSRNITRLSMVNAAALEELLHTHAGAVGAMELMYDLEGKLELFIDREVLEGAFVRFPPNAAPCVYVNGSHNRNFSPEEVGFKVNYPYSVEEFNAALNQANEIWNNDEKYLDSLHSVSVSVYASRTESSTYDVELYASYHSIGEIIDEKQSIASANILGKIKAAISEIENKPQDEIPDDVDKFYVNSEMENVTWIYYNPDSTAGGQFVCTYMSFDDIFDAMEQNDPLEYLTEHCGQELLDRGAEGFDGVAEEFMTDSEDISSRDSSYMSKLFALTEPRYAIFQLKDDEKLRDYHFSNSKYLKNHGMYIDRENYDRVYRGRLQENETLDDIYKRFNVDHPQDFPFPFSRRYCRREEKRYNKGVLR